MKSTRERVLKTLARNPKSTIVDIAESVGINAISVRHHLTSLQASGLVLAEEERHGVGRPRLVYSLTEKGVEKFPSRYYQLTNNLITQMKETLPDVKVKEIFKEMAENLAEEYHSTLSSMPFEDRLNRFKIIMAQEGYDLEWEKSEEGYRINEISCPFYHIGKKHPEICLFDKALIANLLDIPENEIRHIRNDENMCTFYIHKR